MKKSKNKNIISKTLFHNTLVLFMFLQLAVAFSSCNNLVNENEEKTESTLLKISVSSASTARERTALPSFSLTSISGYQFIIEGKKAGSATFEALKTETNTTGIYESLSDLQAAAFPVEPGEWTFKLTASKDGSVLSDQINKTISAGSNSLAFDLVWEDSNLSGTGSLSFSLDFSAAATKSEVANVTGQLYSYDIANGAESELSDSDYAEKNLTNSAGIVNYSLTNLAAGNYRIKIRLYDDKSNLILTWPELAIITGGQQSSKERQITALNPVYTIDFAFNCTDYSLDSGITLPEQYTRFTYDSDWPLPNADKLTRTGYTLEGWYTKADFTGDPVTSIPAGSTGDLHFYAQWAPNMDTQYTVKYFQQNIDDDEYKVTDDTDVLQGTTGSDTEAKARSYTGFTAKAFSQEPINADGSTVINIYYDRNVYTVTYTDGKDKITPAELIPSSDIEGAIPSQESLRYGATGYVQVSLKPSLKGYTFAGWMKDDTVYTESSPLNFTMDDEDIEIYAVWEPASDTEYKVHHLKQNIDNDDYTLADTITESGRTGNMTNASDKTYNGFTVLGPVTQGIIGPDGDTIVEIKYNRNTYTVSYDANALSAETITVPSDTTQYRYQAPVTVKFTGIGSRTGYTFAGWAASSTATSADYTSSGTTSFDMTDNNVTLYAVWEVENQNTGIDVDFGVDTSTISVTENNGIFTATEGYDSYTWTLDGAPAPNVYLISTSPHIMQLSSITVSGVYDITLTATKTVSGSTVTHTWTGQYIKS